MTQCQHCRLERKKRAAHVKCDCGEAEKPHHSKEKCIHLREAEERAKAGFHDETHARQEDDPAHLTAVAEEQGCCCHHGGKCACSLMKREPTSKGSSPPHGPAVPKPRLETAKSDGSITVFKNGHHKPVHHKNHAAHECGMPYKMPLPRAHTEHNVSQAARRSVDSLPLQSASLADVPSSRPVNGLLLTNAPRRLSKSEQPSPKFTSTGTCSGGLSDNTLSMIDFGTLGPTQTNQSVESSTNDCMAFPAFEPMSGMADSSFDPWSIGTSADPMPNNNPFAAWASQFDVSNVAQPALTAASSGTQSEIDEIPTVDDLYGFPMPSIQEDIGTLPMDTVMSETNNANRRSLPPNFFGNADFTMSQAANEWQTPVSSAYNFSMDKSKTAELDQTFTFNGWPTPPMVPGTSLPPRAAGLSTTGRPLSQSVGPSSAPSEDLMKQLFPGLDVVDDQYATTAVGPAGLNQSSKGGIGGNTPSTTTSHRTESPPSRDDFGGFVSQSWSDGSLSVPVDAFTDPYNLNGPNFSPRFDGPWTYQ